MILSSSDIAPITVTIMIAVTGIAGEPGSKLVALELEPTWFDQTCSLNKSWQETPAVAREANRSVKKNGSRGFVPSPPVF